MSFRELANRLLALPVEAPIWHVLNEEREKAQAEQKVSDVEDVLAPFKR